MIPAGILDYNSEEPTAFSNVTVREAGYARIRKEIAAAHELARFWRQRHNELSLIHRLPPEVLSTIFEFIVKSPSADLYWIRRISHICSHWRRIALECPSLWTNIPFRNPKWAREMLLRSKEAPLTIEYGNSTQYMIYSSTYPMSTPSVLKDALAELWRIRVLYLERGSLDGPAVNELITLLNSPAPLLQDCHLSLAGAKDIKSLPQHLFAGDCPQLRELTVKNLSLNLESPVFANLRSFTFTQPSTARLEVSADKLVGALSSMHHLEMLNLSNIRYPLATCTERSANLPLLQALKIESDLFTCLCMSNHMFYPNTTRVIVTCMTLGSDRGTELSSIQKLAVQLAGRLPEPIRSLTVGDRHIIVWTPPPNERINTGSPPQLEILTDAQIQGTSSQDILRHLLQPLPLRHLEELDLSCSLSQDTYVTFFGGLNRLKTITNSAYSAGFIDALSPETISQPTRSGKSSNVRFKALRRLCIDDWDFEDYGSDTVDVSGKTSIRRLQECLRARRKEKVTLEQLDISDCRHVSESEVDALRKIVKKVEWDGEENFTTEEEEWDPSDGSDYEGGYWRGYY